jgi:hypothetical protein
LMLFETGPCVVASSRGAFVHVGTREGNAE